MTFFRFFLSLFLLGGSVEELLWVVVVVVVVVPFFLGVKDRGSDKIVEEQIPRRAGDCPFSSSSFLRLRV